MNPRNVTQLIGNLGQDPKPFNGGCEISLATTSKYTKEGKLIEETQWHKCVMFGREAETALTYLKKGALISICGSLSYQFYENKDGVKMEKAVIKVWGFSMLGPKITRQESTKAYNNDPINQNNEPDDLPF